MNISIAQAVAEVLRTAKRPLTNAEILDRVRVLRPVETANPVASIRSAIGSQWLAVSLGGRPAHYVWWPNRLAGNYFRQPLASLDPTTGQLALNNEVRLSMWPTFFADRPSRPYEVTLMLASEQAIPAQIDFLQPKGWGIVPNPQIEAPRPQMTWETCCAPTCALSSASTTSGWRPSWSTRWKENPPDPTIP